MKKMTAITALILIIVLVMSGCGEEPAASKSPSSSSTKAQTTQDKQTAAAPDQKTPSATGEQTPPATAEQPGASSQEETTYVPDYTIPEPWTQDYQSSLLDRIPFSVDLGVGWEYRDLTVNGEHRRITVTYEMDSSVIPQDPCYTYYRVDIIGEGMYAETVAVGREFFNEFVTDYVRNEEPDRINMELFENDFVAYTFKGKDKDYIVFSIPAGWEKDTSTMVIATDQGKLLADFEVDKSHQVTLQGDDAGKYMDFSRNTNFFSFGEDYITYLKVSQRVDGVTYLKEYALIIDNDGITSVETGKTYTTTDTVPDLPDIAIH